MSDAMGKPKLPRKVKPSRSMTEAFLEGEGRRVAPSVMFTTRMDADLHHRLKVAALDEGRPMRAIIEELLEGHLDGK